MTQRFSYHTHTDFSDGFNTAEEMIIKAKELDWQEIGISDHLGVHKNMLQIPDYEYIAYKRTKKEVFMYSSFAEIKQRALNHFDNLDALSKKHNIKIYKGFEIDYFTYDGWQEELVEFTKELQPDYLMSGNHFFFDETCSNVIDIRYFDRHPSNKKDYDDYMKRHFKTLIKAIESGLFKFIAHLDYARLGGVNSYKEEKTAVIKALAKHNVATELSTKGYRKYGDFFPTKWLLDEAINNNVTILISDDAHRLPELGSYFDIAEEELKKYKDVKRFKL